MKQGKELIILTSRTQVSFREETLLEKSLEGLLWMNVRF